MNIVKVALLFLFMSVVTNMAFSGQGNDGDQAEPECDYISSVEHFIVFPLALCSVQCRRSKSRQLGSGEARISAFQKPSRIFDLPLARSELLRHRIRHKVGFGNQ